MRVTKAVLARALADAAEFNQLPLYFYGPAAEFLGDNDILRADPSFVPVCQYGRGMLSLLGELGTDGVNRYIRKPAL